MLGTVPDVEEVDRSPTNTEIITDEKEEWASDGLWDLVCIQIGPEAFYEDSDCSSEGELEKERCYKKSEW